MWMSIIVIILVGLVTYWWASQGFFSSILHLTGVVVSGAVAFAAWELATVLGLGSINAPFFHNSSWGITLIIVFSISLVLCKYVTDKLCPNNTDVSHTVNLIGGGVAGAASGILTIGILLIGLQFIQGPTKIVYFQGWGLDVDGSIKQIEKLWVPVDDWTAKFYSLSSQGSMFVPNSLAEWHPDLARESSLYRVSYSDGKSRMGLRPGTISVSKMMRVGIDDIGEYISDLSGLTDPDTDSRPSNGDIMVVRLSIKNEAGDGGTKILLSKAQVALVVETSSGDFEIVHPHAFIQRHSTESISEARFQFDIDDIYASSVGSAAELRIGFEFLVPPNSRMHHIMVRHMRFDLPNTNPEDVTLRKFNKMIEDGEL